MQELGEALIALNASELAALSLDDRLHKAIRDAGQISSRGALRRQKQLIGRHMRGVDPQPIRAALARLRADDVRNQRLFARAERWRDRLLMDDTRALDEFNAATKTADAQLRSLLGELHVAFSERAEKTVRRQIFRRVHEILVKISR